MRLSWCCAASAARVMKTARFGMGRVRPQWRRERRLWTFVPERGTTATSAMLLPGHWTQELAADFTAGLEVAARRVMFQVWRAGERGIHRNVLCQRADLTPAELRSLLIRLGRALGRFQRERGLALSRPIAANSPLRSYFVDPEFAAVASESVQREDAGLAVQRLAAPLTNACHTVPGRNQPCSGCWTRC